METNVIETGVDKLVGIVKQRGRIALSDAAKELGVNTSVIQEWVDFLEEEGIISVEYKLTKPFLVEKKLTKREVEAKSREFTTKKDVFVKKAETSLEFLERQAEELKKVKSAFDHLKGDFGFELEKVKGEMGDMEKFQQLKHELQKQIEDQKKGTKEKMDEFIRQITREQKKYLDLASDIKKESSTISKEKSEAKSIEESEKMLANKINELKIMIIGIEKKISNEDLLLKNSETHLEKLNEMMEDMQKRVDDEKKLIDPLIEKGQEFQKKIKELQENIINKITEKQEKSSNIQSLTKKMKSFFGKKLEVMQLFEKIDKDKDDLEKSLIDLIKKAKSVQLAKSKDTGKAMQELEKKFHEVDQKKGIFENELKKLTKFFG